VEEGRRGDDRIVRMVLEEYLDPIRRAGIGSLVLGCTHYPLLKEGIARTLGPNVTLVDSADAVADEVAGELARAGLLAPPGAGAMRFFVSDNPERFREIGRQFLGEPIDGVSLVPPETFFGKPGSLDEVKDEP
jgi:glutamate racemase